MPAKKELFILRHAKSNWDLEEISDMDRPLKLRGIRNAYEMARRMKIERRIPQLFISSPANRALHTASIFLRVLEISYNKLLVDERLYGRGTDEILELITSQDNSINKLMIFGHNPDFSELVRRYAKNQVFELPTCGLAKFTFSCQKWSEISKELQTNEFFDFPKKEF
ncbi:MAG: histidine phosphatase family protein [Bacteroidales bacterium]|nr:histidine phosphatase family protein [Bacteroidales bacterium]